MSEKSLLVPVDYTGCAMEVVGTAADLAARLGDRALLLYVVKLPDGVPPEALVLDEERSPHAVVELLDDDASAHLKPLVEVMEHAGVPVSVLLRHGNVAENILSVARESKVEMIVMGTHGRSGLGWLLEGSVAESVIRKADCPVTVVRTSSATHHPGKSRIQSLLQAEQDG